MNHGATSAGSSHAADRSHIAHIFSVCVTSVFERAGSENVKLPLKSIDRLPKGCPASLCFSQSQDVIDEFIDRVLCSTQVLHEK